MSDMSSGVPDDEYDGAADAAFQAEAAGEMLLAYKKQFIQFALFIAFLVVLFSLTAVLSALSYRPSRNTLKGCLAAVLEEHGYGELELLDSYEIDNPFTVGAAAYRVAGPRYSHAVVIRLTTMVGPVPAVYLYDASSAQADFLCYLTVGKRVERLLLDSTDASLVNYWALRLPQILSVPSEEVR